MNYGDQMDTSSRLHSMGTTDCSAQLVSLRDGVVLGIAASNYDAFGHHGRSHVTARLTLNQALKRSACPATLSAPHRGS